MRRVADKDIVLGTALWGWKTGKPQARSLVTRFTSEGFVFLDTASNYPIDGNPSNEGVAFLWASEFFEDGLLPESSVYLKVGAKDNSGRDFFDLHPEAFQRRWLIPFEKWGRAIYGIGVHFDPRTGSHMVPEIRSTIDILEGLYNSGVQVGFSGVSDPGIYSAASPLLEANWIIQVKENIVTSAARENYLPYFPKATYWAYGVGHGGYVPNLPIGLQPIRARHSGNARVGATQLQKAIKALGKKGVEIRDFHELALFDALLNPDIQGIILGSRTLDQLSRSMDFINRKDLLLHTLTAAESIELRNFIRMHF